MITLGCDYNLRPREWCPADHMSAATLAIADTALEAPVHPQGDGRRGGTGALRSFVSKVKGVLAAARRARPRGVRPLRSHSSRQQRVTHLRPLREGLAKGGAPVLAHPHRPTPSASTATGPLGAHHLARPLELSLNSTCPIHPCIDVWHVSLNT